MPIRQTLYFQTQGTEDRLGAGTVDRRNGWQAWRNWTGRLWHAYRAKFATEMVDVPDRVLVKLSGWKNPRTLDIYQQPSDDVMLEALEHVPPRREPRGWGGRQAREARASTSLRGSSHT